MYFSSLILNVNVSLYHFTFIFPSLKTFKILELIMYVFQPTLIKMLSHYQYIIYLYE